MKSHNQAEQKAPRLTGRRLTSHSIDPGVLEERLNHLQKRFQEGQDEYTKDGLYTASKNKDAQIAAVVSYYAELLGIKRNGQQVWINQKQIAKVREMAGNQEDGRCVAQVVDLIHSAYERKERRWSNIRSAGERKRLHDLCGTLWYMYMVKSENSEYVISRLWVHVKQDYSVHLESANHWYKGHMSIPKENQKVIFIEITEQSEASNPIVRSLRLLYSNTEAKYLEGFMITYNGHEMYSNNVLWVKIRSVKTNENKLVTEKGKSFPFFSKEFSELIPEHIQEYFAIPSYERHQIRGLVNSNQNPLEERAAEKLRLASSRPFEHDIYIACPITHLSKKQYSYMQEFMELFIDWLVATKWFAREKIYTELLPEGKRIKQDTLKRKLNKFGIPNLYECWARSKNYILISPFDNVASASQYQLGFHLIPPLAEMKPCVVLTSKGRKIPAIINNAFDQRKGVVIGLESFTKIDSSLDNSDTDVKKLAKEALMEIQLDSMSLILDTLQLEHG